MNNQKGITLVALIITIIVMLILVSVSIAVIINSDLLGTAKDATDKTTNAYREEGTMGQDITVNGVSNNISDFYKPTTV